MNYANSAFGEYLEHSVRYYVLDAPVISDAEFDSLCAALLAQWPEVTHRHRWLCDETALQAGTGYQIVGRVHPRIVQLCQSHSTQRLSEVFNPMPAFRDKFEEQAYGAICLLKYGSYGGQVNSNDIKRIGDYLRGGPARVAVPVPVPKPAITVTVPTPAQTVIVPPVQIALSAHLPPRVPVPVVVKGKSS